MNSKAIPDKGASSLTQTIGTIIAKQKIRKGPSDGTTADGAFWLLGDPILIRDYGGDGLAYHKPQLQNFLQLRHFRNGKTEAVVHTVAEWAGYNSDCGPKHYYEAVPTLIDCKTIEEAIVILKGTFVYNGMAISQCGEDELEVYLMSFGLPEAEPAPDDAESSDGSSQSAIN